MLSKLVRALKTGLKGIFKLVRWIFRSFGMLLGAVFGRWQWQSPAWLKFCFRGIFAAIRWIRTNPGKSAKYAGIAAVFLIAAGGAWYAYSLIPKPELITLQVTDPPRTEVENDNPQVQPLVVQFSASAAPLDKVGKEITGLHTSPELAGRWSWRDDQTLVFEPAGDWPVGQQVEVSFEHTLLTKSVRLDKYSFEFKTAPFEMSVKSSEFYQDPVLPDLKKAIVTIGFSHPVSPESFEKRVTLRMRGQSSGVLGIGGETTPFTVTYDKKKLTAFIHSGPLPIPPKDTSLSVKVDSGVSAQSGGTGAAEPLEREVAVPGLFSLAIDSADMHLVNNERYEPEQVLMLETSAAVHENDMNNRIEAWVLPVYNPETPTQQRRSPYWWSNPQQIGERLLKQSERLQLNPIPIGA